MRPPEGVGSWTSDVRSYLLAVSPTDQEDDNGPKRSVRPLPSWDGWTPEHPLPDDATLARALRCPSARAQMTSSILPYQEEVKAWWEQGFWGTSISALIPT